METVATLKAPFYIFDDVPAVIDGTVIAQIWDGKTCIGKAELVLPCYGISEKRKLEGWCLFAGKPGKQYSVSFTATNLWAMEQ